MRITNRMLSDNFLNDMYTNLENMQNIQSQLTSGKKIRKPSDDPYIATRSLQIDSDITINKQYNTNISNTKYWLNQTDTALNQAGDILQRIKELLVSAGNGSYTQNERDSIKEEINQRICQFSNVINSNFNGQYLFGGSRGTEKPLDTVEVNSSHYSLIYNDQSVDLPVASGAGTTATIASSCGGLSIKLGSGSTVNLTIPSGGNINSIVNDINSTIASSSSLKGKVSAISYTNNNKTYIRIISKSSEDITILSSGTTIHGLDSFKGKYIGEDKVNMVSQNLSVEISQGVLTDYNVSATDLLKFKGTTSSGIVRNFDLREVFNNIINDLSSSSGLHNINTSDADAIKSTLDNILSIRAKVGATQNRMDTAQQNNEDNNYNMNLVLSKTEDTDITESTMNYAALQTVYLASLQTSAKVLQPTLMDYMS